MVFYNEGGADARRKEVGENCTLFMPNGTETAVTSVSFTEEANTSEVQFNDSFAQSIAVTGVTYSGSFEIPGRADIERDAAWDDGLNDNLTTLPEYLSAMTIENGDGRQYTFTNVLINSHNKDMPSDDRTTQSFDFMAEKLVVD